MKESKIEKQVTEYAESLGWVSFKWASPGHRGVPDRLYFRKGMTIAIEFKHPDGVTSLLQLEMQLQLMNAGILAISVSTLDSGKRIFTAYEK